MVSHSSHAVLPLALVAGAMVLTAAACGSRSGQAPTGAPGGATVTPTVTATTTTTSAPTPVASSTSPSTTTTSTGGTGRGTCTVGRLRIRYADDEGGGAAGSVFGTLSFTNTGSASCRLRGFPGVSYVGGGNGSQIGQPATRTGNAVATKTLAPGTSAKATLRRTQPANYGDQCQQGKVDGLRVYPPGSTTAAFVAFPTTGCGSTSAPLLQVGPVR